jgi:flavin-dependent thymidylate synthase
MSGSKEVQKWADRAMWEAVPTNTTTEPVKPKVTLVSITPDPLGEVASAALMYVGRPATLETVTHEDRIAFFKEQQLTRLNAPFEFVQLHFLFEGVTRAFTHQLVRQRTATYVQESQRFAVKTNGRFEVALPPSLVNSATGNDMDGEFLALSDETVSRLGTEDRWRVKWDRAVIAMSEAYDELVNDGMPAEDARGLLPTNITTRIHYRTDLRNLIEHAGNRLCTQAQFEWRTIFNGIATTIAEAYTRDPRWDSEWPDDEYVNEYAKEIRHEYQLISGLFRPICYLTGKCEFMGEMDRHCSIRERVEDFHHAGVPSRLWESGVKHEGRELLPIHPAEWLLDSASARVK